MASSLILPTSATYCVTRNLSAHTHPRDSQIYLQRQGAHQRFNFLRQTISNQSKVQSLTFIDRIAEYGIPSELLNKAIREDMEEKTGLQQMYRSSTLCSINHCGEQYFVHSGGSHMDELIIRNGLFTTSPQMGCEFLPGFSTNIGQGAPLRQILYAGSSHGGTSSNLIVSTLGEIVHLQSISGPDFSSESGNVADTNTKDFYDGRKRREQIPPNLLQMGKLSAFDAIHEFRSIQQQSPCPMLDPKGKWQLPHEIWQLTSLSCLQSPISQTLILTKNGKIFSWTPGYGVRLEIDAMEDFVPFHLLDVPFSREDTHLAGMLHPKLAHFSHLTTLTTIDLRCKRVSLRKSWRDSVDKNLMGHTKIYSVKHHGRLSHQYMISTDRAMLLMDMRNERCPISQQSLTQGHANLDYYYVEDHRSRASIDFYVARSSWQKHRHSQQIFAPDVELHSLQTVTQMSPAAVPALSLLDANCMYASRWQVDRFPVIDRDLPCIGTHLHTSAALSGVSKADAAFMADIFQELPQSQQTSNLALEDWLASKHNAVLLQQNSLGDIYAQQLWWDAVPGYSPPENHLTVPTTRGNAPSSSSQMLKSSSYSQPANSSSQSQMTTPANKRSRKDSMSTANFSSNSSQSSHSTSKHESSTPPLSVEKITSTRHSATQWHCRLGERGRSPRAILHLYRRFLQLVKFAQTGPAESNNNVQLQKSLMDIMSLLATLNPLLSQQLFLLHRCLQPTRSLQGSTMMHLKLHPGLRLPLTLPMPRDASAHRRVASVGFYRSNLPEDSMQTHDVFLLDLRAIHLHRYPSKPKLKSMHQNERKLPQSLLQSKQKQLEFEESKHLFKQKLHLLHSFLIDEYGINTASNSCDDTNTQVVRLSLFEIWHYLHHLPQCRESTSPMSQAQQSTWSLRQLYNLLQESGLQETFPRPDRNRLSLRFEHSTVNLYSRFSDGYFVTGVRPSRVDRVSLQRAFLRQQQEQLQQQQSLSRSLLRQETASNRKKRSFNHTADSDTDAEFLRNNRKNNSSTSFTATSVVKTERKMCECYWRLTTVTNKEAKTEQDKYNEKRGFCDRQDCVMPHHILFSFSLRSIKTVPVPTSNTVASTDASDSQQPKQRDTSDLLSLIQATSKIDSSSSNQYKNNSTENNTAVTATPATSLLSQLIFQSQPLSTTTPSVAEAQSMLPLNPRTPAPSATATAVSQQQQRSNGPLVGTPAGWQHSDVTSDLVAELLNRWDTVLLPTPNKSSTVRNILRERLAVVGRDTEDVAGGDMSAIYGENYDDERDFYKTPYHKQLPHLQSMNRSINLSHFWELGDDESD